MKLNWISHRHICGQTREFYPIDVRSDFRKCIHNIHVGSQSIANVPCQQFKHWIPGIHQIELLTTSSQTDQTFMMPIRVAPDGRTIFGFHTWMEKSRDKMHDLNYCTYTTKACYTNIDVNAWTFLPNHTDIRNITFVPKLTSYTLAWRCPCNMTRTNNASKATCMKWTKYAWNPLTSPLHFCSAACPHRMQPSKTDMREGPSPRKRSTTSNIRSAGKYSAYTPCDIKPRSLGKDCLKVHPTQCLCYERD